MEYFLRSTNDLTQNYSYHQTGLDANDYSIDQVSELLGCDLEDIEVAEDNTYIQVLSGLCCYKLDSDNLEDAIEEANEMDFTNLHCLNLDNLYLFSGKEIESDFVIEGTIMRNQKAIVKYINNEFILC